MILFRVLVNDEAGSHRLSSVRILLILRGYLGHLCVTPRGQLGLL